MKKVDRRSLLRSCAAAALFSMMPDMPLASSRLNVSAFLQKSRELTEKSNLDPVLGSAFFHAFQAQTGDDDLLRLIHGSDDHGESDLAKSIIAAWYTGIVEAPSGPELVTYSEALVWNAMRYTKPPGECGGRTGYWADPPEV